MNAEPAVADIVRFLALVRGRLRRAQFVFDSVPGVQPEALQAILGQLRTLRGNLADANNPFLTAEERLALHDVVERVTARGEHLARNLLVENIAAGVAYERTGAVGAPRRADIDVVAAVRLYNLGYAWPKVARMFNTSRQTLDRRLRAIPEDQRPAIRRQTNITDIELDVVVRQIKDQHPNIGAIITQGHLRVRALHVPLARVKQSLARVDPRGALRRLAYTVDRRVYSVPGAQWLWHFDAYEKLKPWGFEVHGGVDGQSRMLLWTEVRADKRAETVLECFLWATTVFGWPVRVRCDEGTENVLVGDAMIDHWGEDHNPFLTGRSLQNIRMERLWRDVRKDSAQQFRTLFMKMEAHGLLRMNLRSHRVCLYLTFAHRIQAVIDESRDAWNMHGLTSEHGRSPVALFEASKLERMRSGRWPGDGADPTADIRDFRNRYRGDYARAKAVLNDYDFARDDGCRGVQVFINAVEQLKLRAPNCDQ